MLHHIRRHLAQWAQARGAGEFAAARFVCLDDAKGLTEGVISLIFPRDAAVPAVIAKCAPLASARWREGRPVYRIDYENLVELESIGMSLGARTTPEPLGVWDEDGVLVTLQSALDGELLKNVRGRTLFANGAAWQTVEPVLDWLAGFERRYGVERRVVDEATYRTAVLDPLTRFTHRFVLAAEERRLIERRLIDERRLLGGELPFTARHGDFCPANIFRGASGVAVFDWEFPLRRQLPLFDLFHFFSATRFPFKGLRGESTHFESFKQVFWGDNLMNRMFGLALARVTAALEIPASAVGDLFLLSLIEIANLKYDGLLEINRIDREPDFDPVAADDEKLRRFRELGFADKDVPFARLSDGASENLRFLARCGLPPCVEEPQGS